MDIEKIAIEVAAEVDTKIFGGGLPMRGVKEWTTSFAKALLARLSAADAEPVAWMAESGTCVTENMIAAAPKEPEWGSREYVSELLKEELK